ncbi:MAG: glycosyltransferase family 2 protein [Ekhidna sp.]
MQLIFWLLIALIFYTYVGYGILIYLLVKVKGSAVSDLVSEDFSAPEVTHIIAAYNEEDFIRSKIENALSLNYPSSKHHIWIVTDGSDDRTPAIVKEYENVRLFHQPERKGKIHAINRVMEKVKTPITVFSDANTELNKDALLNIVRHYNDPKVGCVAGEKRVRIAGQDSSEASEGLYWKYESFLKKYDYQLYSVVGAAGELFSIRTVLHQHIQPDTLIEDFLVSLSINRRGFKTAYEPDAYALENSSQDIIEESKRKIRIAAGAFQAMWRLRGVLNIFKYGWLTFQYVSHRVLRWTVAPLALPIIFFLNLLLINQSSVYYYLFVGQVAFYLAALLGYVLQRKKIKIKALFIPFYFSFMNACVMLGFIRYLKGSQSALWERAKRKSN